MVRSETARQIDIGTFDGTFGDRFQHTNVKTDIAVVPTMDPETGDLLVTLHLTIRHPAKQDQELNIDLPEYYVDTLADQLNDAHR